jgi:hypothetical protein
VISKNVKKALMALVALVFAGLLIFRLVGPHEGVEMRDALNKFLEALESVEGDEQPDADVIVIEEGDPL